MQIITETERKFLEDLATKLDSYVEEAGQRIRAIKSTEGESFTFTPLRDVDFNGHSAALSLRTAISNIEVVNEAVKKLNPIKRAVVDESTEPKAWKIAEERGENPFSGLS